MVALGTGNSSRTCAFQSLDALIWSMTILILRPNPSDASATWPNVPLEASECGLYFCVKTYKPTLQNGDLQETETVHSNLSHDSQKIVSRQVTMSISRKPRLMALATFSTIHSPQTKGRTMTG